ncbi:MAG: carbohydrate-binding module family 14 protein [Prochlorotrichaceae cyanobacterium]
MIEKRGLMKMRKMLSTVLVFLLMASSAIALAVSDNNEISALCPASNDPNAWTILLPNPVDCSSYYVCDWGEAILMPCPAGLHFNASLSVCDRIEEAGCTASQWDTKSIIN